MQHNLTPVGYAEPISLCSFGTSDGAGKAFELFESSPGDRQCLQIVFLRSNSQRILFLTVYREYLYQASGLFLFLEYPSFSVTQNQPDSPSV